MHSLWVWLLQFQDVLTLCGTDQQHTFALFSPVVRILSSTMFQFLQTVSASIPIFSAVNNSKPLTQVKHIKILALHLILSTLQLLNLFYSVEKRLTCFYK
ncbi:hypothetical protein AAZX31_04G227400 [Glycine max]